MRSLLAKCFILMFVILSLGTGLAWASTSSRPGMFLYPLKKTTQRAAQILKNIPAVEIHLAAATPVPVATDDDQAGDPTTEPTATTAATATSTATTTRAPTPAKAADKLIPTATAGADPGVIPTGTITPSLAPPIQVLSVESLTNGDDQSSQRKDESSHDNSSKNKKPSSDSGKSDSEEHSSEESSSEHD
jgi:hypothetical protein